MICPHCKAGYMLSHPEDEQAAKKWLKCTVCGYCEKDTSSAWEKIYRLVKP